MMNTSALRSWTVLLIGGSSGTGKTVAARELGLGMGVPWMQADDLRLAIERVTGPDTLPVLHSVLDDERSKRLSAERMAGRLIELAQIVSNAAEIVVANHVATAAPLILEGDGLLPAMAAGRRFAGLETHAAVRAVFVYEADEQQLFERALRRGRGFEQLAPEQQRLQARQSWLYGNWLREQALLAGLPVVLARPLETLARRIAAELSMERGAWSKG